MGSSPWPHLYRIPTIDILATLKTLTLWLASGTEAAAALVISLAVVEGVVRALLLFIPHRSPSRAGPSRAGDAS